MTTTAEIKALLQLTDEYMAAQAEYERLTKAQESAKMVAQYASKALEEKYLAVVGRTGHPNYYAWEVAPLIRKIADELSHIMAIKAAAS